MLGKRSKQRGLFEADTMHIEFVGRDSFYGYLASQRGRLFRDEDFADLYCHTNGRSSVPPSLLATALAWILQPAAAKDGGFGLVAGLSVGIVHSGMDKEGLLIVRYESSTESIPSGGPDMIKQRTLFLGKRPVKGLKKSGSSPRK